MVITNQEIVTFELLLNGCKICKADNRGWYICDMSGRLYLHSDGTIYFGVQDETAFWETAELAEAFYTKWVNNNNYKMQMDTKHSDCFNDINKPLNWKFCPVCGCVLSH